MTNEQLALLLDPRREKPGWWVMAEYSQCPKCGAAYPYDHKRCARVVHGAKTVTLRHVKACTYTGPDYHASDDACFRDWRPVLLAAGCRIECVLDRTDMPRTCIVLGLSILASDSTYHAATLAAIEELHTTKPELLRGAIARVEDRK